MTDRAIGASKREKSMTMAGLSDWVTVWGAPLPYIAQQIRAISALKEEGYTAREFGHFIQVLLPPAEERTLEQAKTIILSTKEAS